MIYDKLTTTKVDLSKLTVLFIKLDRIKTGIQLNDIIWDTTDYRTTIYYITDGSAQLLPAFKHQYLYL